MKTGSGLLALAALLTTFSCSTQAALPPVLFYSDLDGGPGTGGQDDLGAFVTIWGKNLGSSPSGGKVTIGGMEVARYLSWKDDKIVFQVGGAARSGDISVTGSNGAKSNGLPFSVHSGRIFFLDAKATRRGNGTYADPWSSPVSFYEQIRPGDIAYFRGGTYQGNWGGNWGDRNLALGASKGGKRDMPVALVGYPGETAVLVAPEGYHGNMVLTDTTQTVAHYVTVANLKFEGSSDCFGGGGFWRDEKSGGTHIRVVGNHFSARYRSNTMTGLVVATGDHWKILGNDFADTGTSPPINNNHALYIQSGASDIEVGWNRFRNLRMGHVIQVHTDIAYRYENIRIHDNLIVAKNPADSRGINVGNAKPGTYGAIYNNILINIGQDFSAIAIYWGDWKVYNNTLASVDAGGGMIWLSGQYGGTPTAEIFNNILVSNGRSPYVAAINGAKQTQITSDSNLYYGYTGTRSSPTDTHAVTRDPAFRDRGNGDLRLRQGSPAIDAGSSKVLGIVARDHDGTVRPQKKSVDIGAFEASD